jgi:drug/metabolite transporter (DMT)-like permease
METELHVVLFCVCVWALYSRFLVSSGSKQERRRLWSGFAFIGVLLLLGSLSFCAQVACFLQAFVDHPSFPGGAAAYLAFSASGTASTIANICNIIIPLFSDCLLVSHAPRYH